MDGNSTVDDLFNNGSVLSLKWRIPSVVIGSQKDERRSADKMTTRPVFISSSPLALTRPLELPPGLRCFEPRCLRKTADCT